MVAAIPVQVVVLLSQTSGTGAASAPAAQVGRAGARSISAPALPAAAGLLAR